MLKPIDPNRCPVDQALEVIAGKWKPLILWRLAGGTLRYAELQRAMPGVTQRMLTLQLRELQRDGLITRTVYAEVPPRVEYALTEPAAALMPVMATMGGWWSEQHRELRANASTPEPAGAADAPASNVRRFRTR